VHRQRPGGQHHDDRTEDDDHHIPEGHNVVIVHDQCGAIVPWVIG